MLLPSIPQSKPPQREYLNMTTKKNSKWYGAQDELPMTWNHLAWSAYYENDWSPPPAARDAHEAVLGENRWWCGKLYQHLFDRMSSQKVGKSESTKIQSKQLRTCKAPWPGHWWPPEAPLCCAPLWIKDRQQSKIWWSYVQWYLQD